MGLQAGGRGRVLARPPASPVCLLARRQVVSRSYVGCIKNVEIARSNFDLLRDAFGVRKGCVLEVGETGLRT